MAQTSAGLLVHRSGAAGRIIQIPEADAAPYFVEAEALIRIHAGQRPILCEAFERLRGEFAPPPA